MTSSMAFKPFTGLRQSSPLTTTTPETQTFTIKLPSLKPTTKAATKSATVRAAMTSPKLTGRNLRVAVIGGGPAGGSAAETLAKAGIETFLIERKKDHCKPCGGAIPLCMVGEFDLPPETPPPSEIDEGLEHVTPLMTSLQQPQSFDPPDIGGGWWRGDVGGGGRGRRW